MAPRLDEILAGGVLFNYIIRPMRVTPMTEQQWLTSEDPRAMLDYLEAYNKPTHRQLRMFAAACYRPDKYWSAWSELTREDPGAMTALDGARVAIGKKVGQQHCNKLSLTEKIKRADLMRDVIGNPFQISIVPKSINGWVYRPPWITSDAESIARGAYDEVNCDGSLDGVRLAVLSDALEEAGCRHESLLEHLRRPTIFPCPVCPREEATDHLSPWYKVKCPSCNGDWVVDVPHVRGCWAVDLVMGKQ